MIQHIPAWTWGLIGAIGAPLIGFLWQSLLSDEKTEAWGVRIGAFCRIFLFQELGASAGNELVNRFKGTVAKLSSGVIKGLEQPQPIQESKQSE